MKLIRKSGSYLKNKILTKNNLKFSNLFFYWVVPLTLLVLTAVFLIVFNYSSKQIVTPASNYTPSRVILANNDFSADFYFNDEFGNNDFSKAIIGVIDKAKEKVELAVYSINHSSIRDALYKAAQRGVSITLILGDKRKDQHDKLFSDLPRSVKRLDVDSNEGNNSGNLMHHKFVIIDRGSKEQTLMFGSYNFTELQEKYDPSFLMETNDIEIIRVFGEEFDRLMNGFHGRKKLKNNYNPFAALIKYPQGDLEIWFSPQKHSEGLRNRLLNLIRGAKHSLDVMVWDMTDEEVARSLVLASTNKPVKILIDDVNFSTKGSVAPLIASEKKMKRLNNLSILTDSKRNKELIERFNMTDFNSFLHHHLLIVDNNIVLFGTNNWSKGGFYNNDESIMVTNIPSVVEKFRGTFENNYNKAR